MTTLSYKRLLVKFSGEAVAGQDEHGIDPKILDKMAASVKDSEISIQELLDSKNAKIESYSRLKVGEGIEVESKSFADEVAEQLK